MDYLITFYHSPQTNS
nr:RecName: Full=Glutathione S-transferase [Pseudomonas sp. M1]